MAAPDPDQRRKAREAALRLLAVRARSARELKDRLKRKGFPSGVVEQTIRNLQARGYQSDEEFARQFAREKWTSSGWGPARVRQELVRKGIAASLRERVIAETYGDDDLTEALLPLARKRWASTEDLPTETRRRRLVGFLQRRGYDWETTKTVLNRVRGE